MQCLRPAFRRSIVVRGTELRRPASGFFAAVMLAAGCPVATQAASGTSAPAWGQIASERCFKSSSLAWTPVNARLSRGARGGALCGRRAGKVTRTSHTSYGIVGNSPTGATTQVGDLYTAVADVSAAST